MVMVTVNLMPEIWDDAALIARGGSSCFFTVIALGMILSVSRQNDEHSHDTPRSESIYESGSTPTSRPSDASPRDPADRSRYVIGIRWS